MMHLVSIFGVCQVEDDELPELAFAKFITAYWESSERLTQQADSIAEQRRVALGIPTAFDDWQNVMAVNDICQQHDSRLYWQNQEIAAA